MQIIQSEDLRLRPAQFPDDCVAALPWYSDPEVLHYSEGAGAEPYSLEMIERMYQYLMKIGELYMIEVRTENGWLAIGDATLSQETLPIVIGNPKYRSKGIGSQVIDMLIERAKILGWEKLKVKQIFEYNERSRRLYARHGFRETGGGMSENGLAFKSYEFILK
jgi:RimJ/RimL family protein N-acetyltransferase